jgi:16S rRNA (cytosine967-C5)-methyltransferase
MAISKTALDGLATAAGQVLSFAAPADVTLKQFFLDHPKMGAKDRSFVAESVFGMLRRKRWLDLLVPERVSGRLWAAAALVKLQGCSLRELETSLTAAELKWLRELKSRPQPQAGLAVQAELPDWVVEKLRPYHSEAAILTLGLALQRPAPLDLRVNTLLATREDALAALRADGLPALPTVYSPVGVRLMDKVAIQQHAWFRAGKIEVQDEGSQLIGYLLAPRRGEMIVDFCAGAGGKSLLLGALMHNHGRLYAFDVSEARLKNLEQRRKRSGLSNVHAVRIAGVNDAKIKRLRGKIDRVLTDVPCSGFGTLRRNPDLKWRQSPAAITELTLKQAGILEAAAGLVKPGGRLVYATCSILAEENERIIDDFLARHAEFQTLSCADLLAQSQISLDCGTYLMLSPHQHGTDGFFAAALQRSVQTLAPAVEPA